MPLERVLDLCRQVPLEMVRHALYAGTPDEIIPRLAAEIDAGARHFALCNYVGFLSRAEAPAATGALLEVVRGLRARFPHLAERPALLGIA
jgi:alkanesulfonate monooxygenase SsuD/methylene tetrahydromethanopterin reductase-like flavin-dependent oxidoreductase (luciferase family)